MTDKKMQVVFHIDQNLLKERNIAMNEEWEIMEDKLNDRELEIQRHKEALRLKRIFGK